MATATTVPITIAEDAGARVQELGLEREFQMMLEQLKHTIPGLRTIEVTLEYPPDYEDDPMILLTTHQPRPTEEIDATRSGWRTWAIDTFSPDVLKHFVRLPVYEAEDAR